MYIVVVSIIQMYTSTCTCICYVGEGYLGEQMEGWGDICSPDM